VTVIRAVLWDFGGVISSSPFEAFAAYEQAQGLPDGFLRRLNAVNPDTNAWAQLERSKVDLAGFAALYQREAAEAGGQVDGHAVMSLLTTGSLRPAMLEAVRRCRSSYKTALLTNNFLITERNPRLGAVLDLFDLILESSKVGIRKPDVRFYQLACEALAIDPTEAVFLDDLGVNLKPARQMGMTTIKVGDPDQALDQLEQVIGISLRDR
jgi:putative hydrolase of the HAD superfamily